MSFIKIFDTTLRDGEQAPGNSMSLTEKLRLAHQLERLGVDVIEAGFPIASPDDFESVRQIARICERAEVCGLARALEHDIRKTYEAIKDAQKPRIHTFVATSDIHLQYKLKKTRAEVLEMTKHAVSLARSLCDRVDFSPEDATRSERDFLYQVLEIAIAEGADTLNIPDTVGYSSPEEFGDLILGIMHNVKGIENVIISTHCHNDLGLAVANSLAGVKNGARQIECTINGIGERAGNAALEEVVMALRTRKDYYGFETNILTTELIPTSKLLTSITGVPVQPNKAIVGANAFAHEAGIHQHGMLAERATYEIMKPEDIGLEKSKLVLGKHSGRHALKDRLTSLGYTLEESEIDSMFEEFKKLADKKKQIFDEDLMLLVNQGSEVKQFFSLVDFTVQAGTKGTPHAIVILHNDREEEVIGAAYGSGPIDAVFTAIDNVVSYQNTLMEYSVNAITQGIDAQATVAVRIEKNGQSFSGSGSDIDIVCASVKAYLDAVNRALFFHGTFTPKDSL